MAFYQKSLKTFFESKLSENTKGVLFDVNLYNDIMGDNFNEQFSIENTYATEFKRKIPTMITNIQGEYIPIPNLNGTSNSLEIIFDLAVDDMTGTERESEFEYVDYNNSLLAIDEFKNSLLANYYPLGTSSLFMGGSDSTIVSTSSYVYTPNFIYIKFTPKSNDVEELLRGVNDDYTVINKTETNIVFQIDGVNEISVPYTIDIVNEITITKSSSDLWTISNNFGDTDTYTSATVNNFQNFTFGYGTGFFGILDRLVIDNDTTETTIDNVENPIVDLSLWDNKDLATNQGVSTNVTTTINNSILYGSDGNAVFQVYPLAVIGEYQSENGINYHSFSLQLEVMIGDNFIFGNNFEYYIDDIRVYPVDRSHAFALDIQGRQLINENTSTFIGSESSIDWTQTFFYQPTALLNSLVKKITTGVEEQNKVYVLKIQYPFWSKEYNVLIEGGGMNTDINSITTFTLQYKLADDILSP
jgi:hypothetical protein